MRRHPFRVIMATDQSSMLCIFTDAGNPVTALQKALESENLRAKDIIGANILDMSATYTEPPKTGRIPCGEKPVRFYVASNLTNAARVKHMAETLAAMNMVQTYDWTTHCSVMDKPEEVKVQVAINETEGVMNADLVVVMLPGRLGTHTELGMAIALGKKVIVWAEREQDFIFENKAVVFYYHPNVERLCCPFDHLVDRIKAWRANQ